MIELKVYLYILNNFLGGSLVAFLQFIEIIGRTFLAVFEAIFSLLPIFRELGNLKDQLLATAIGVPVVFISTVGIIFAFIKLIRHFLH